MNQYKKYLKVIKIAQQQLNFGLKSYLKLEHYQDNIVLSGIIYIDEMFYKVIKKDVKHTIDGKELKKFEDKDNPLGPINKVINLIQKFLNTHSGFNMMN